MAFYGRSNFAYALVATPPVPASSGTFLIVTAGLGAIFPTTRPFPATIWPANVNPLTTNGEVVLVTDIIGDTMEIVRSQESSTAMPVAVGYQIAATLTKGVFTQFEVLLQNNEPKSYLVGTTASAPTNGATTWVLSDFANAYVALFLNGQKVYNQDMGNGAPYITKVLASTTVTITNATFTTGDVVEYILIKSSS